MKEKGPSLFGANEIPENKTGEEWDAELLEKYLLERNAKITSNLLEPIVSDKVAQEAKEVNIDNLDTKFLVAMGESKDSYPEELLSKIKKDISVMELYIQERKNGKYKGSSLDPLRRRAKELLILCLPEALYFKKEYLAHQFFHATFKRDINYTDWSGLTLTQLDVGVQKLRKLLYENNLI